MAYADKDKEKAHRRAYYLANKDKVRAYNAAHYAANADAIKATVRAYAAEHREEISARGKADREAHPDKHQARSKAYYKAHREERIAYQKALHATKPETVKAYKRQWWKKNAKVFSEARKADRPRLRARVKKWYDATYRTKHREKFLARNAKRRALKATTIVEPIDFMAVLRDANGLCGICHKPLDLFGIDFDHIVPLARGGPHTRENIQATHSYCNRSKGARVG